MHKWTHSRLKPTKIQTVKKCPEHILRGSAKPLMWVAWSVPSPAQKDILKDDLREHCYQLSAQTAKMGPDLVSENIPSLLVFKVTVPPNQQFSNSKQSQYLLARVCRYL